jgi:hypothetical protein
VPCCLQRGFAHSIDIGMYRSARDWSGRSRPGFPQSSGCSGLLESDRHLGRDAALVPSQSVRRVLGAELRFDIQSGLGIRISTSQGIMWTILGGGMLALADDITRHPAGDRPRLTCQAPGSVNFTASH